jgi:hypothetical protein
MIPAMQIFCYSVVTPAHTGPRELVEVIFTAGEKNRDGSGCPVITPSSKLNVSELEYHLIL